MRILIDNAPYAQKLHTIIDMLQNGDDVVQSYKLKLIENKGSFLYDEFENNGILSGWEKFGKIGWPIHDLSKLKAKVNSMWSTFCKDKNISEADQNYKEYRIKFYKDLLTNHIQKIEYSEDDCKAIVEAEKFIEEEISRIKVFQKLKSPQTGVALFLMMVNDSTDNDFFTTGENGIISGLHEKRITGFVENLKIMNPCRHGEPISPQNAYRKFKEIFKHKDPNIDDFKGTPQYDYAVRLFENYKNEFL